MENQILLIVVLFGLAFSVGFAIRRGTICAVAAARALIIERQSARFRAFGVSAAAAGLVLVPLQWFFPNAVMLSPGYPITVGVCLAGVAFGLGARLNDACVLGTLSHLTGGNLKFAASVLGMVFGAVGVTMLSGDDSEAILPTPSILESQSVISWGFIAALFASLVVALHRRVPRWIRGLREPASVRLGPYRAMLIIGICGGLLYALAGNWTYMSVMSRRAARMFDTSVATEGWPVVFCAIAVFGGGLFAALRNHTFNLRFPRPMATLKCFVGGTIMGASAAIIPGGNGAMLVHGLPSLAPHAIGAYFAMTVALCVSFFMIKPSKEK